MWNSLEPVQGVGDEEVAHLVAAVVEDERAPVGVLALTGVGVLVQGRAVEAGQRPVVAREVGGHPVDDHADAPLVQVVDEEPEVVGGAEARRRARSSR